MTKNVTCLGQYLNLLEYEKQSLLIRGENNRKLIYLRIVSIKKCIIILTLH